MRLGLQVIEFDWTGGTPAIGPRLRDIAVAAENAGYTSLWLMDHFKQMPGFGTGPEDPMLECFTGLAWLAAHTSRIELGPLVSCVAYRHPGVLLKTVATLDVLSGGRAWLGVGAGWYDEEATGLGVPWPPLRQRYDLLSDTLRLARRVWRDGDETPFTGDAITVPDPVLRPAPLRPGGPRVLIGGTGERRTLRLVARYGDACNLWLGRGPAQWRASGIADVRRWLGVIAGHCADVGRDPAEIETTAHATVEPDTVTDDDLRWLRDALLGIDVTYLIVNMIPGGDPAAVERVARVIGS